MACVKEHYDTVLAEVYSWLYGGFNDGKKRSMDFFKENSIKPAGSGISVDLGAGSGFQSIPLAESGFNVISIDLSKSLLEELKNNKHDLNINIINDNFMNFQKYCSNNIEIIVCMTDTLLHLDSIDDIITLFKKSFESLENNGRLILTFRDMTDELIDLDRFIPVKSDQNIIFTCFLEYEEYKIKVHDLVYIKKGGEWNFKKSFYRKLRLSKKWTEDMLINTGFNVEKSVIDKGFIVLIARKKI